MTKQGKIDIIKQHISNVIEEEQTKYQTTPEVFIFDKKDFFEDSALRRLNNKFKLIRNNPTFEKLLSYSGYLEIPKHFLFFIYGGFTDGKKITILMNEMTFKRNFNEQLYFKILSTFHEFRHIGQMEKFNIKNIERPIKNFDNFRYLLEKNCHRYLLPSYTLAHDDFYFELDANLYGIDKADEYCAKNGIFASEFQKRYKQQQYSKMLTYDFDNFITLNQIITKNPIISNRFQKNPTYRLFFNKIGSFNKLSDIINNPLFFSLDDKLKTEMLTSRPFLSSINYSINDFETNILFQMIDGKLVDIIDNYNKNREFFEQCVFDYNSFIKNSSILLSKMEYLLNFKMQHTKVNDNKNMFFSELQQQVQNIRTTCNLNNRTSRIYSNKEVMNNQLNNIISTLNNFFINNKNLHNTQELLSTVKVLQEAILAKIDISSLSVDVQYEQLANEDENKKTSIQNSKNDVHNNNQQDIPTNVNLSKDQIHNVATNYLYAYSPGSRAEIPQIDSSKVRKRTKGNISYQLLFFVNVILSIIITIGYIFMLYK